MDFSKIQGWNELTARQKAFCLGFLRSGNGAAAAREAGYAPASAEARASKLKSHPLVSACLRQMREMMFEEEGVSLAESRAILSRIARSRIGDVMNSAGGIMPDQDRGGIASLSVSESDKGSSTSVRLRDPVAALSLLAKLNGWGEEKETAAVEVAGVTFTFDFKRGGGNAD
jgi:hypothetical protein